MASTKGIPLAPLTGAFDPMSSPDEMASGTVRMRQNFQCVGEKKLRRGTGWEKLLNTSNYNNQDFHDQLLTFTDGSIRQPILTLFRAESTRKVRSLFLATQGKIAKLNGYSGNWQIIGDRFGGTLTTNASAPRFKVAQLGDYLAFTNNFDKPRYHILEQSQFEATPLINEFADLNAIGLSRAAVVWEWKNCLFFADVEMDGQRYGYRLLWSNYLDPIGFDPANAASITGRFDLDTKETILGGAPSANGFLIYTSHGIWEMTVVGGAASFAFRRAYNGEENQGVGLLKYPNTLLATSLGHIYLAENGPYSFNQYATAPVRTEWLYKSAQILYKSIDATNCQVHIAGQDGDEIFFFTADEGSPYHAPNIGLRVNLKYSMADKIDHGFTAILNFRPASIPTIRDFIVEHGICTLAGLAAAGYPYLKEGLPRPLPAPVAAFTPENFYTSVTQSINGKVTEDWTQSSPAVHSLCSLLAGARLDDFCLKCEGDTLLVAACSTDWCLKQLGRVFYRERCSNPTAVGSTTSDGYISAVGTYLLDGYESLMTFAPVYTDDSYVKADRFQLDYLSVPQDPPTLVCLRVGISAQVADSNEDTSRIVWFQHSCQPIKVLTNRTPAQHAQANTLPADFLQWVFERQGKILYFELSIDGTGGDATFSKVITAAKRIAAKNY